MDGLAASKLAIVFFHAPISWGSNSSHVIKVRLVFLTDLRFNRGPNELDGLVAAPAVPAHNGLVTPAAASAAPPCRRRRRLSSSLDCSSEDPGSCSAMCFSPKARTSKNDHHGGLSHP